MFRGERMLILDKNQVYVKDYKELMELNEFCIKIKDEKNIICIQGVGLEVLYYDQLEIRIKGKVKVIQNVEYRL